MQDLRETIIRLGNQFEQEDNAAHDLWTWLPSYKAAQAGHGDYAVEQMPSVADILLEAATFISHGLKPSTEQIAEAGDIYRCPCGEDHAPETTKSAPQDVVMVDGSTVYALNSRGENR